MTENKRYFKKEYDEEYYIFDSEIISEKRVDKFIEYDYKVFASSMTDDEIVDRLNEQEEQLTTINEFVFTLLNKLDIQDAFIRDYFEIIKKCDLKRMNNIIKELRDVE